MKDREIKREKEAMEALNFGIHHQPITVQKISGPTILWFSFQPFMYTICHFFHFHYILYFL